MVPSVRGIYFQQLKISGKEIPRPSTELSHAVRLFFSELEDYGEALQSSMSIFVANEK